MAAKRAAIYGGTFDPVHNGHLKVARRVQKLFGIDELVFVPAYVPPHKRGAGITSPYHRFAMLALATQNDESLRISRVELEQPDRPYAVHTVARAQEQLAAGSRLFFIMGADSWSEITSWHDWQRLLTMCNHIVVSRPGYVLQPVAARAANMLDVRGKTDEEIQALVGASSTANVFMTDAVFEDVSATTIRAAVLNGDGAALSRMVPAGVAAYIAKYRLYRTQ